MAIDAEFKVDTREFEKALLKTLAQTSRDVPDVINSAAIDIITTAARLTKKADKSVIENSLAKTLAPIEFNSRGKALKKPKLVYEPARLVYLIINARRRKEGLPGLNNADMSKAAQKFIKKRVNAIGFIAFAGWQKALLAFGGRGFGSKASHPEFDKSSAAHGRGIKATVRRLYALMENTADGCVKWGSTPLQVAFYDKTQRMMEHLEQKLAQRCDEANRS